LWTFVVLLATTISMISGQALMGVDLGSNEVKIATIKNAEFSIVLNEASKRKSINALGFDGEERLFGEGASSMRGRLPKNVALNAHLLLAVKANSPITKTFGTVSMPIQVEPNERGGVALQVGEFKLQPEEVVGMSLHYMAQMTKSYGKHQELGTCVIAVPPYFSIQARAALRQAAEIAGVRAVKVVNDNAAVALRYGQERSKDAKDETVLFIDVGAESTSATIATYHNTKAGKPVVTVKAVAWDAELGGRRFDLRLTEMLADKFDKQTGLKIRENLRAYTKLLNAASKAKMQLSANEVTVVSIGSLMNDKDFQVKVERKELDELCSDLYSKIAAPVKQALDRSGLKVSQLSHVVPFGAGWRVPGLQHILKEELGIKKLDTILNSDEAAAFGAVFIHGNHSGQLRVREVILHDATVPPKADEAALPMSPTALKAAQHRHQQMVKAESDRKIVEAAKSGLEAWVYGIKEKAMEDDMEKVATEEDLETVNAALAAAEEWIYDEGDDATLAQFEVKKEEIKKQVGALMLRYDEFLTRPTALKEVNMRVTKAIANADDWKTTRPQIPQSELAKLRDLAVKTQKWVQNGEAALEGEEGLKKTPPFTTTEIIQKSNEIKDLQDVLRLIKPKTEL